MSSLRQNLRTHPGDERRSRALRAARAHRSSTESTRPPPRRAGYFRSGRTTSMCETGLLRRVHRTEIGSARAADPGVLVLVVGCRAHSNGPVSIRGLDELLGPGLDVLEEDVQGRSGERLRLEERVRELVEQAGVGLDDLFRDLLGLADHSSHLLVDELEGLGGDVLICATSRPMKT